MRIRFSPHAIKRLQQRFGLFVDQVTKIIERGVENDWTFAANGRRKIDDTLYGRRVRVIFSKGLLEQIEIITVMWLDR